MQIIQNRKKFFILSLLVIIIGFGFRLPMHRQVRAHSTGTLIYQAVPPWN